MHPQESLFDADAPWAESLEAPAADAPLAERLRPRTLDEVIGQRHLLGPGKPLRVAFESGRIHSMILWGPPGVGKTTLARLVAGAVRPQPAAAVAGTADFADDAAVPAVPAEPAEPADPTRPGAASRFVVLSAVLAGVKDIREAVVQARLARASLGQITVVFVDEVHRFNKAQQDAFLPHVESGLFTFIGATSENPSFEVNSALLSRATVQVLKPLDDEALGQLIARARAALTMPPLSEAARQRLIGHADGDARRLLNAYEVIAEWVKADESLPVEIDEGRLEQALGEMLRRYDKGGDQFYDMISALHKSVRGSDPDAALYWLARMLDGGVDARYVARRLIRMASEDIGLADPRGQQLALQAADVYERLGSPEGELALAQAVVYLAVAPKSNAVYQAWNAVRALVKQDSSRPVPMHLRNAPTRLMKGLGHGAGYRYAHDEAGGFAAGELYLPDGLASQSFYQPAPRGLELRIGERLAELRRLNAEALGGAAPAAPEGDGAASA